MRNNGDGTLAAPTLVDSQPSMNYLAVGSLRSNGKADIAVAQRCNSANNLTGGALLYLGKGDGTFQPAAQLNTGFACPNVVAIADMNADSKPDLVFAGSDTDINATSGFVAVFLGNGDGTLHGAMTTAVPAFIGSIPTGIAVADVISGSSVPGVLLGELGPHGDMFVLLGNGDGTFDTTDAFNSSVGINGKSLQVTDLTGQGLPDLLLASGGAEANGAPLSVQVFAAAKVTQALAATKTTLMASASTVAAGQSVTFTATVAPQAGSGTPTGSVNFLDGTTAIGSGTLNGAGVATSSTTSLNAGTHSIIAAYQGDTNFAASTSTAVSVQVTAGAADFSVSASPSSQTVTHGQGTSYTLTLTPVNGFNQAVTVSCSGAPSGATCSPASSPVALNGSSASQDQINITLSAGSVAFRLTPTSGPWQLAVSFAFLPAICVLSIERLRRRPFRRRHRLALFASGLLIALAVAGCAGKSNVTGGTTGGTPAGTYTLTLTGTSGNTTHSTTVSLTVQ